MYKPLYSPVDGSSDHEEDNTFLLEPDVEIYGGFAGTEQTLHDRDLALEVNKSILSGDLADGRKFYHVVMSVGEVGKARLDGFTISDGRTKSVFALESIPVNGA